ncbi:MAG: thymidylate synthase [Patescibacteria group bacterium]
MEIYREDVRRIMREGVDREDRTGVGSRFIFGIYNEFFMQNGFPIVTSKYTRFRSILAELLWFMAGDSDEGNLRKLGCKIWQSNAEDPRWQMKARFPGDVGRNYGVQWRSWNDPNGKIDQLYRAIEMIKEKPNDRRNLVTAWNPGELDQTALPPCHVLYQFSVSADRLSVGMYQRSCDFFLGVPFNISSYALLLHLVAQFTLLIPDKLAIMFGDSHIYRNQFKETEELLRPERQPFPLPHLWINPEIKGLGDVDGIYHEMLRRVDNGEKPGQLLDGVAHLKDYRHHSAIKAPMAV